MKAADILKIKGSSVETIPSWAALGEVIERLAGPPPIGALVVCDDGRGHVRGLVTERDVIRGIREPGRRLEQLQVADVMSHCVPVCSPEDTLAKLMAQMTHTRYRYLPVVDEGSLCGLVSIGDVVRHRLNEMQLQTDVLRDMYIAHR